MKHKILGQVYTPDWIVSLILDLLGYDNKSILDKFILEPSCGDGAFLLEITRRYISISLNEGVGTGYIIENLEKYIFGVELDEIEYEKTILNLNLLVKELLGKEHKIRWNVHNVNTLEFYKSYLNFFDFVVGNPPYIRIQNLDLNTKEIIRNDLNFSEGTFDIYLSFFEVGLKMLKPSGILGYITPNSYLRNSSYKVFREFIMHNNLLDKLIDFKSNKIFKDFSTYTAISILNKLKLNSEVEYFELEEGQIKKVNNYNLLEISSNEWSFCNEVDSIFLKSLNNRNGFLKDYFDAQYGFATLRDKIFIGKGKVGSDGYIEFNNYLIEEGIVKKIIKASTFKGDLKKYEYIIFPYQLVKNRYVAYSEHYIGSNFPKAYKYLLDNRSELEKRDLDHGVKWFEFGRSQGVQTCHQEKMVISTLVFDKMQYFKIPKDILVYSGIFIVKKSLNSNWKILEDALDSQDFLRYIKICGKDFSGGYKSVTSRLIKDYKINAFNPNLLF